MGNPYSNKVKRLLSLRRVLDNLIDNAISENVMRDRPLTAEELRESLIYQIDEHMDFYKEDR